jgi:hypothetical protein
MSLQSRGRAFGYHQGQRSDQAAPKAGHTIASDPSVGTLMSLQSRGRPYTARSSSSTSDLRPFVLTHWRQRMGEERLVALIQETWRSPRAPARRAGRFSKVIVYTTVQPKAGRTTEE